MSENELDKSITMTFHLTHKMLCAIEEYCTMLGISYDKYFQVIHEKFHKKVEPIEEALEKIELGVFKKQTEEFLEDFEERKKENPHLAMPPPVKTGKKKK